MNNNSEELEEFLGSSNTWRRDALDVIRRIPAGYLATYGRVADMVREKGHSVGPRQIAWFRRRLYELLGHESNFPLHRIAKIGYVNSLSDSEETKQCNDTMRTEEGFFENPRWL